jgi:uncharacterized surface protein with fasciclin (FAS1) repeats
VKRVAIVLAAVAALAIAVTAQAATKAKPKTSSSTKTALAVIKADPQLSMFAGWIKKAGLDKSLSSTKKVTVFAPDNAAIKKLSKTELGKLTKDTKALAGVVLFNVVSGSDTQAKLEKDKKAKTEEGADVALATTAGKLHVGKATVIKANMTASNGEVDEVNAVLAPPK